MVKLRTKRVVKKIPEGYPLPFHISSRLVAGDANAIYVGVPRAPMELHHSTKPLPVTNKKVVVKYCASEKKEDVAAARYEASVMAAVGDHANIVKYYGSYSAHKKIFIAMEYCKADLFTHCFPVPDNGPAFTEKQILPLFTQIILGLDYLHKQNIVHCDIKLENIFITEDNRVVLGDFGLSKVFDPEATRRYGPGTVIYGAPETCLGLKVRGPEIDVWSAGIVLYLLCEGYFPYDGDTRFEIIKSIASSKKSLHFTSRTSAPVRDLIYRMLQLDPEARITIEEMKQLPVLSKFLHMLTHISEERPESRTMKNKKSCSFVDLPRSGKVKVFEKTNSVTGSFLRASRKLSGK